MRKKFNDTGLCVRGKHYMVDTDSKIEKVLDLVHLGKYFTINSPRQFGKTTTASFLYKSFLQAEEYLVIRISFEIFGDETFASEASFVEAFLSMIAIRIENQSDALAQLFTQKSEELKNIKTLGKFLKQFVEQQQKKTVLIIDEVDSASSHQVFLRFLAMLRDNYLFKHEGEMLNF